MSTPRHPNLEGAFTPSGRGTALEGLLKPRRPSQPATSPAPEQVDEPVPPVAPTSGGPVRPKRTRKTTSGVQEAGEKTLNVAAYLPVATLEAAQQAKRVTGEQYADLLARAFDDVDKDALRAAFTPRPAADSGTGMPRRVVRARGAAGIQRQFRLTAGQRDWLDEQVRAYGAPSRSAFIAAVLGLHFNTLDRP